MKEKVEKEKISKRRRKVFSDWIYKMQQKGELAGFCMAWFKDSEIKKILEIEGITVK